VESAEIHINFSAERPIIFPSSRLSSTLSMFEIPNYKIW